MTLLLILATAFTGFAASADVESGKGNVAPPTHPLADSGVRTDTSALLDGSVFLTCSGTGLASAIEGINVRNPSEPSRMFSISAKEAPGKTRSPWAMSLIGETLYVGWTEWTGINAPQKGFLEIYDLHVPSTPKLLSSLPLPAPPKRMAVTRTAVYITDDCRLYIVDVSDLASPRLAVEPLFVVFGIQSLAAEGSTVYLGQDAIKIFDVSDVASPKEVHLRRLNGTTGRVRWLSVQNARLYAVVSYAFPIPWPDKVHRYADSSAEVDVFDVSNPSNPQMLSREQIGKDTDGFVVGNGVIYAFSSASPNDVYAYELKGLQPLSVPCKPGTANAVCLYGDKLFTRAGDTIRVFDVKNPARPHLAGTYRVEERR